MSPMSKYVSADGKKSVVAEGIADTLKIGEETYKRQTKSQAIVAAVTPPAPAAPAAPVKK